MQWVIDGTPDPEKVPDLCIAVWDGLCDFPADFPSPPKQRTGAAMCFACFDEQAEPSLLHCLETDWLIRNWREVQQTIDVSKIRYAFEAGGVWLALLQRL